MARILGGNASRLEVYALFVAAVVLIGGSISGAIVVSSSGDEASAPVTVVELSSTTVTTAVPVEVTAPTTTEPTVRQLPPPTTRYVDPPPVTVTPEQPVQDFSAYCTMPNLIGMATGQNPTDSLGGHQAIALKLREAGCPPMRSWGPYCYSDSVPLASIRIVSQEPAPGTLIHRSFGTISLRSEWSSENTLFPPEMGC